MKGSSLWLKRWTQLIDQLTVVASDEDQRTLLTRLGSGTEPVIVAFINAHAMNMVVSHEGFFDGLRGASILLRDGVGMSLFLRWLGLEPGLNMNGTDLIPEILRSFAGRPVALLGTAAEVVEVASRVSEERFSVKVVATADGFATTEHYAELVSRTQPDLIVLGMGMPKQEQLAQVLASRAKPGTVIVCGGAILDFLGGKVERAPRLLRDLRLEWAYRLLREPRRLFRRYVLGNPAFLTRALWASVLIDGQRMAVD